MAYGQLDVSRASAPEVGAVFSGILGAGKGSVAAFKTYEKSPFGWLKSE